MKVQFKKREEFDKSFIQEGIILLFENRIEYAPTKDVDHLAKEMAKKSKLKLTDILGNGTQLAGEIEIDDHAILSGHVLVHQFVRIGGHVMISGGSLVRKDVPPYVKAAHEPLSYVGINSIGLRRNLDGLYKY